MSIEEMIKNGASPEEINAAMQEIYLEKERAEKDRAKQLAEKEQAQARAEEEARREMLKREARAYVINALLAYIEVFDLLPEGEEIDEDDIKNLEQMIIKVEDLIPLYYQIAKLQDEINEIGKDDEDFGLFGFGGRL